MQKTIQLNKTIKKWGRAALLVGAASTLCASAADFPTAGGDIASNGADGWNGAKPGPGEEAKFTQAGTK